MLVHKYEERKGWGRKGLGGNEKEREVSEKRGRLGSWGKEKVRGIYQPMLANYDVVVGEMMAAVSGVSAPPPVSFGSQSTPQSHTWHCFHLQPAPIPTSCWTPNTTSLS